MTTIMNKERAGILQEKNQALPAQETGQYTLWQILGIWALAALPMVILSWVVFPAVSPDLNSEFGDVVSSSHFLGEGFGFLAGCIVDKN